MKKYKKTFGNGNLRKPLLVRNLFSRILFLNRVCKICLLLQTRFNSSRCTLTFPLNSLRIQLLTVPKWLWLISAFVLFLIHQPYSPESNLVGLRITRFFFFILSNCARGMPQRWGDVSRSIYSAALRGNQFQKTQKLNRAGWICEFFKMILGMLKLWTLICCLFNEYDAVLINVWIYLHSRK